MLRRHIPSEQHSSGDANPTSSGPRCPIDAIMPRTSDSSGRFAYEEQAPLVRVPHGEGEHAIELLQHRWPLGREQVEEHLGVGVGRKALSARLERRLEVLIVVDLSVVDRSKPPIRRGHGHATPVG